MSLSAHVDVVSVGGSAIARLENGLHQEQMPLKRYHTGDEPVAMRFVHVQIFY